MDRRFSSNGRIYHGASRCIPNAQRPKPSVPKKHVYIAASVVASILGIFLLLPSSDVEAYRKPIPLTLDLAPINDHQKELTPKVENNDLEFQSDANPDKELYTDAWKNVDVGAGDNLAIILKRVGLSSGIIPNLLNSSKQAKALTNIYPGHQLNFLLDENNELVKLIHKKNRLESTQYTRAAEGYVVENNIKEPEVRLAFREGTIESSLYMAATKNDLSHNTIMELANIFGWDIDFALDIREGDNFELLLEQQFLDGEKLSDGKILAAKFTNQNKVYEAVLYTDRNGISNYFTPQGLSMRKEFLRTPVDFVRISSHFNLNRQHPVLHTIRAHKGTDYAAKTGTPVRATGNGKVVFAGRKGGYGNVVIIQHDQKYQTLYAHLSRYNRNIRPGTKVKQGDIVAFVGSTGLATGPHLHYEFRVNGAVRNPVTVELPMAHSISNKEKSHFLIQAKNYLQQLASYKNGEEPQLARK